MPASMTITPIRVADLLAGRCPSSESTRAMRPSVGRGRSKSSPGSRSSAPEAGPGAPGGRRARRNNTYGDARQEWSVYIGGGSNSIVLAGQARFGGLEDRPTSRVARGVAHRRRAEDLRERRDRDRRLAGCRGLRGPEAHRRALDRQAPPGERVVRGEGGDDGRGSSGSSPRGRQEPLRRVRSNGASQSPSARAPDRWLPRARSPSPG